MSGLPIALLIWLMTKRNSLPAWQALPLSAAVLYLIKLIYFNGAFNELNASVVAGLLFAYTPLMIVWGAITLFLAMEATGCMDRIRVWLGEITPNRTAQLMLIGWAFSFLIEGASGFGTPIALAAPLLVGLGFPAFNTAVFCILMNSAPVSFGAVGTPTWFGLSVLNLDHAAMLDISFKSAFLHCLAALVVCPLAVGIMEGKEELKRNFRFVMLSTLSCLIPYLILAKINYEFPAILGGGIGLILTAFMARHGIGLAKSETPEGSIRKTIGRPKLETVMAFMPIWGSIAILLITRIKELGIKPLLVVANPAFHLNLGPLGDLSISPALVMKLTGIFGTNVSWEQKTLYIPGIIPFIVMSVLALLVFKAGFKKSAGVFKESYNRIKLPCIALYGALVLVNLLMLGGDNSCAMKLGNACAALAGKCWIVFAPYLGALGAFFAGSNTVSNLTFAGIQFSIAKTIGMDPSIIVALQSVGGAMGHMVCLHNIVTVCSILGISAALEGKILRKTFLPMFLYGAVAVLGALLLMAIHF